jgi:hypothetical protein
MPITKEIMRRFTKDHTCFIETGTYDGDTALWAVENGFADVYTVELNKTRYEDALKRFENYPNVRAFRGHSPIVLRDILCEINVPVFFWLDAHPDYGDTPLLDELNVIGMHHIKNHTILIDDMRCMGQNMINVTKEAIHDALRKINIDYKFIFVDDGYADGDILVAVSG